jgi:hypothetical protein
LNKQTNRLFPREKTLQIYTTTSRTIRLTTATAATTTPGTILVPETTTTPGTITTTVAAAI